MKKLKIVAFGDSLTAGSALSETDTNWTDLLAKAFNAEVINSGIGGHTSAQGLERMERDVTAHSPDAVLICFGMNDHVIKDKEGSAKVAEDDFCRNLAQMVTSVRASGAIPILITPNSVIEEYYFTRHPREWYEEVGGANAQLSRYCARIREVAKSLSVPLADVFSASRKSDLKTLLRTPMQGNFADGVHPYGAGIPFYANVIIPVLKEALL